MQGIRKSLALVAYPRAGGRLRRRLPRGTSPSASWPAASSPRSSSFGARVPRARDHRADWACPRPSSERAGIAHYRSPRVRAHAPHPRRRALSFMGRTGMLLHVFPQTVTADLAFGVVGELAFDGPCRSQPARINHGTAADIVVGRWFTLARTARRPAAARRHRRRVHVPEEPSQPRHLCGGALAPTMTVPTGTIGEFCYMGAVVVPWHDAVAIGQAAWYDTTTGVIGAGAPAPAKPPSRTASSFATPTPPPASPCWN
jgi:hypothetical protein